MTATGDLEKVLIGRLGKDSAAADALADLYEERGEGGRLPPWLNWRKQETDDAADAVRAVDWRAAAAALSRANGGRRRGTLTTNDLLAVCRVAWLRAYPASVHAFAEAGLTVHGCDCEHDWKVELGKEASAAWVCGVAVRPPARLSLALAVRVGGRIALDVAAVDVDPHHCRNIAGHKLEPFQGWWDELTSPRSWIWGHGLDARTTRRRWHRLRRWAERRLAVA